MEKLKSSIKVRFLLSSVTVAIVVAAIVLDVLFRITQTRFFIMRSQELNSELDILEQIGIENEILDRNLDRFFVVSYVDYKERVFESIRKMEEFGRSSGNTSERVRSLNGKIEKLKDKLNDLYDQSANLKSPEMNVLIVDTYALIEEIRTSNRELLGDNLRERTDNMNKKIRNISIVSTHLVVMAVILMASMVAVYLTITGSILNPIIGLKNASLKLSEGDFTVRVDAKSKDEIGQLSSVFNETAQKLQGTYGSLEVEVQRRTAELEKVKEQLEKQQLALLNVLQDVNEAKKYQETQSKNLLTILSEGVVITDENGAIDYINPTFEKMLGFNFNELKDKTFSGAFKVFDLKQKPIDPSNLEDKAMVEEAAPVKLFLGKKDGNTLAVIIAASSIVVEGVYKGVIRIIHDYSEDVRLQQQKDDFFSIASHELRTPLTVISGSLDNILQGYGGSKLTPEDLTLLKDVVGASDRLIAMVNDFLNVSRLDQGRIKMDFTAVDFCSLGEKIVGEMQDMAKSKNIYLKFECAKNHGPILADEGKIREVLVNLIGNSMKFTKEGGITVSQKVDGEMLVTMVSDTGLGIAKDKQELLFQRFQQAMNRTLAREAGGTGLGLYISREFARLMGGDLWLVESAEGKGSVFAFKIPLAKTASGVQDLSNKNS